MHKMTMQDFVRQMFGPQRQRKAPKPPRESKLPPRKRSFMVRLPEGKWCVADGITKSEVRAEAKKLLGVDRLPVGVEITLI